MTPPGGKRHQRAAVIRSTDLGFPPEVAESGLELLHDDAFRKGTTQTASPSPALAIANSRFSPRSDRRPPSLVHGSPSEKAADEQTPDLSPVAAARRPADHVVAAAPLQSTSMQSPRGPAPPPRDARYRQGPNPRGSSRRRAGPPPPDLTRRSRRAAAAHQVAAKAGHPDGAPPRR